MTITRYAHDDFKASNDIVGLVPATMQTTKDMTIYPQNDMAVDQDRVHT